jgi:uncharacterized protein (DUF924 family)
MSSAADLVAFWFGELNDGFADTAHRLRWFQPDREFDAECDARFAGLLASADTGKLHTWQQDPLGRLALILLCDQIPRNIFRGRADAFRWDGLALSTARDGVAQGMDQNLAWDHRCFFYMPFEHSEDILDQHLAVGLFTLLRDQSPKGQRSETGNYLRFAQQHRDIVLRFGRFPHRNEVLGRNSSAEERAFVDAGDGFGQNVD